MAAGPDAIRITRWRGVVLGAFWRSGALLYAAQIRSRFRNLGSALVPIFQQLTPDKR